MDSVVSWPTCRVPARSERRATGCANWHEPTILPRTKQVSAPRCFSFTNICSCKLVSAYSPHRRSTTSPGDCLRHSTNGPVGWSSVLTGRRRWSKCGGSGLHNSISLSLRVESNFLMKDQVPSTGNRLSAGSVKTCVKSKTLPTFGPGPMAYPKPRAALSLQFSIRWCQFSPK